MSGPNLSQYFSNNPPSLFDEIVGNDGKKPHMSTFLP